MAIDSIPYVEHPLPAPAPHLMPGEQFREIAKSTVANTPEILDFLSRCEACGLPVEDRKAAVEAQCEFCMKFLRNFWPDHTS